MKSIRLILVFTIIFSLVSIASLTYAAESKIGYVDLARLFDNYNKTKDEDKTLEKEIKQKKEERQRLVNQIRKMKNEIDILSEEAKEKKQTRIDEKVRQLQEYDQQTRVGLGQQKDKMVREILKEIDAVIEKYAKDNSYAMILNKDKRILLYGHTQDDITDEILKILNSKYK